MDVGNIILANYTCEVLIVRTESALRCRCSRVLASYFVLSWN